MLVSTLVFVFVSSSPSDAILAGLLKSWLFAMVGTGMGIYFGRRKAKLQEAKTTPND